MHSTPWHWTFQKMWRRDLERAFPVTWPYSLHFSHVILFSENERNWCGPVLNLALNPKCTTHYRFFFFLIKTLTSARMQNGNRKTLSNTRKVNPNWVGGACCHSALTCLFPIGYSVNKGRGCGPVSADNLQSAEKDVQLGFVLSKRILRTEKTSFTQKVRFNLF